MPEAVHHHLLRRVTEGAQRGIERVFAHRPQCTALAGKHEAPATRQLVEVPQDLQSLTAQRDEMRATHFGALGRYHPFGRIKIKLAPLCSAQFSWTREHQRRE